MEEVKQAICDCESSKSLGPNGYNFLFINEFWKMLKEDVMRFMREFHRNRNLPRATKSTCK